MMKLENKVNSSILDTPELIGPQEGKIYSFDEFKTMLAPYQLWYQLSNDSVLAIIDPKIYTNNPDLIGIKRVRWSTFESLRSEFIRLGQRNFDSGGYDCILRKETYSRFQLLSNDYHKYFSKTASILDSIPSITKDEDGNYEFSEPLPFEDLPEEIQTLALKRWREEGLDYEWWDGLEDVWKERLEAKGFSDIKFYFSLGYSQSDFASIQGNINIAKYLEAIDDIVSFPEIYEAAQDGNISSAHIGEYGKIDELNDYSNTLDGDKLFEFEEALKSDMQTLNRELYYALREEYEYLTSDESIKETFEANEYTFDENGHLALMKSKNVKFGSILDTPELHHFEVGDKVRILKQSIGYNKYGIGEVHSIADIRPPHSETHKAFDGIGFEVVSEDNYIYVIKGNFYTADRLELVRKAEPKTSSILELPEIANNIPVHLEVGDVVRAKFDINKYRDVNLYSVPEINNKLGVVQSINRTIPTFYNSRFDGLPCVRIFFKNRGCPNEGWWFPRDTWYDYVDFVKHTKTSSLTFSSILETPELLHPYPIKAGDKVELDYGDIADILYVGKLSQLPASESSDSYAFDAHNPPTNPDTIVVVYNNHSYYRSLWYELDKFMAGRSPKVISHTASILGLPEFNTVKNSIESANYKYRDLLDTFFHINPELMQQDDPRDFKAQTIRLRERHMRVGNTTLRFSPSDLSIRVKLHSTDIVVFFPDHIELYTGGWNTTTTRQRINEWLDFASVPVRLFSKSYTAYVSDNTGTTYEFDEGLQLDYMGHVNNGTMVQQRLRQGSILQDFEINDNIAYTLDELKQYATPGSVWLTKGGRWHFGFRENTVSPLFKEIPTGWVGFGSWGKSIAEIKKYNRDDNNYAGLPFSEEDFPMKQVNTDNLAFSSILNSVPQPEEEEFHLNESYINKSVSSGTLRPEDVIPAMAKVLEFEAPTVWKQLEEDEPTLISEYIHALERNGTDWRATRNEWFESERGDEFNEVLENILNDIAPEGCYFGANEGDMSDFGFWEIVDPMDDDRNFLGEDDRRIANLTFNNKFRILQYGDKHGKQEQTNLRFAEDSNTPQEGVNRAYPQHDTSNATPHQEAEIVYPTVEQILQIHDVLLEESGTPGIQGDGMIKLEAAIGRMQSSAFGQDAFPTVLEKAAILIHSIITTHPFIDANKRTACMAGKFFLHLNNLSFDDIPEEGGEPDIGDISMHIAQGEGDHSDIHKWLENNSKEYHGEDEIDHEDMAGEHVDQPWMRKLESLKFGSILETPELLNPYPFKAGDKLLCEGANYQYGNRFDAVVLYIGPMSDLPKRDDAYEAGSTNNNTIISKDTVVIQYRMPNFRKELSYYDELQWFINYWKPMLSTTSSLKFSYDENVFRKGVSPRLDQFRGWISPSGERIEIGDLDHADIAERILRKQYSDWDWEKEERFKEKGPLCVPIEALEYKGWVRVVWPGSYSVYEISGNARDTLIELISQLPPNQTVYVDVQKGTRFQRDAQQFLDTYGAITFNGLKAESSILELPEFNSPQYLSVGDRVRFINNDKVYATIGLAQTIKAEMGTVSNIDIGSRLMQDGSEVPAIAVMEDGKTNYFDYWWFPKDDWMKYLEYVGPEKISSILDTPELRQFEVGDKVLVKTDSVMGNIVNTNKVCYILYIMTPDSSFSYGYTYKDILRKYPHISGQTIYVCGQTKASGGSYYLADSLELIEPKTSSILELPEFNQTPLKNGDRVRFIYDEEKYRVMGLQSHLWVGDNVTGTVINENNGIEYLHRDAPLVDTVLIKDDKRGYNWWIPKATWYEYVELVPNKTGSILLDPQFSDDPTLQVGDGQLPNKYWVSKSSDFLTNKNSAVENDGELNHYDWATSAYSYDDFPPLYQTLGCYNTFKEALRIAESQDLPSPTNHNWDNFHSVAIEDRLSGVIFEAEWHEIFSENRATPTYSFREQNDSNLTKRYMEERGLTFE